MLQKLAQEGKVFRRKPADVKVNQSAIPIQHPPRFTYRKVKSIKNSVIDLALQYALATHLECTVN
jgi:hypothetical protein